MNVSCLGKGLMTSPTSCSQTAQQPPQAAGIAGQLLCRQPDQPCQQQRNNLQALFSSLGKLARAQDILLQCAR